MQRWTDENGFSESTVSDDLSCGFAGVIDGDNVGIQVAPPRDEIVPHDIGQEPILIGAEHGATVTVNMH